MLAIYTDGACYPNPGPGGWGFTRSDGLERFGGSEKTTNNRMEMQAIAEALRSIPVGGEGLIYSDSQYCVNGANSWRQGWARKGWRRKFKGQILDVLNVDLWKAIAAEMDARPGVRLEWVKGHNGTAGNERADRLANLGRIGVVGTLVDYRNAYRALAEQPIDRVAMEIDGATA